MAENKRPLCRLTGRVVHGRGLGRKVDMPTANLLPDPGQTLPELGVYAARCRVDGETYLGVTNVGLRPTVDQDRAVTVETYVLGLSRDLYGREMELELWAFLRPTRKMASLAAVKAQVEADSRAVEALLGPVSREKGEERTGNPRIFP